MPLTNKYLDYSEDDFVHDPLFRTWILAPDEVSSSFWSQWLAQHPGKQPVLENARWQLLQVRVEEEVIVQERLAHIWEVIQERKVAVAAEASPQPVMTALPEAASGKVRALLPWQAWQKVAAVFLMAGFCAALLYYFFNPAHLPVHQVSTAYGETKVVTLPDHSRVVLNGNSTLSFADNWREDQDREVSLQGEAFFSVTHAQNHRQFRVKLKDGVRVTVLGTQFTVTQRPTKTQVVLNEGKVKLSQEQERYFGLQTAVLDQTLLQPGDLVEVQPKGPRFHKTRVDQPREYAAFTCNKIIFKNTVLSEVARVLEDTYGYRVTLARPGLADKHFSGTTPTGDIDMLLSAIEKLFQVQILKNEKQIIIK